MKQFPICVAVDYKADGTSFLNRKPIVEINPTDSTEAWKVFRVDYGVIEQSAVMQVAEALGLCGRQHGQKIDIGLLIFCIRAYHAVMTKLQYELPSWAWTFFPVSPQDLTGEVDGKNVALLCDLIAANFGVNAAEAQFKLAAIKSDEIIAYGPMCASRNVVRHRAVMRKLGDEEYVVCREYYPEGKPSYMGEERNCATLLAASFLFSAYVIDIADSVLLGETT